MSDYCGRFVKIQRKWLTLALAMIVLLSSVLVGPAHADEKSPTNQGDTKITCTETTATGITPKSVPTPTLLKYFPEFITLRTNCGDIVIKTVGNSAPLTLSVFTSLITNGYFDQTLCHRLTTSGIFVLQCGDPTATGSGGPNFRYNDENLPAAGMNNYPAGTVAMANSGANTNGSQFFLTYQNTTLAPSYTIWGNITSGLDIVRAVASTGVTGGKSDGAPSQKIALLSVSVLGGSYSDTSLAKFTINGIDVRDSKSELTFSSKTSSFSVEAVATRPGAKAVISGGGEMKLGKNVISVNVTAQDGVTTKKYDAVIVVADAALVTSPTPTPSSKPTASPQAKKITITCVKGKAIKKVIAVKPVCPKGYKKKS
jgi:peptidyl-prolyl cis-trans isomerase B (cyclophilin B)